MRHVATNANLPPLVRQRSTNGKAQPPGPGPAAWFIPTGGRRGPPAPGTLWEPQSNGRRGLLPPCRPSETQTAPPSQALGATNANPRGAAWNPPASLQTSRAPRPRGPPRRHPLPAGTRRCEGRDSLPPPPGQREPFNGRQVWSCNKGVWESGGKRLPGTAVPAAMPGRSAHGSAGSQAATQGTVWEVSTRSGLSRWFLFDPASPSPDYIQNLLEQLECS